jgi:hypothetical protein
MFATAFIIRYMMHEVATAEQPPEHEGEKYLRMLGLMGIAEQPIPGHAGKARDFLDICGDHARPMLVGFEHLETTDPRYEPTRETLRSVILHFVGVEAPQET